MLSFFAEAQITQVREELQMRSITEPAVINVSSHSSNSASANKKKGSDSTPKIAAILTGTICEGDCFNIRAVITGGQPPYTVQWNTGQQGEGPHLVCPTEDIMYTYTVIDANGNSNFIVDEIWITVVPITSVAVTQVNVSCNGGSDGSISLVPSGGTPPYSYLWWPGGKTTSSISGLSAGTYSVVADSDNSCRVGVLFNITQPSALSINISNQTDVKCKGDNTGSATVNASGGVGGYTYSWSTGKIGPTANKLTDGVYTVTVTDNNGCTKTKNITITEPSAISISITDQTDVKCNGDNTGSATVNASGGVGGYTYSWSTGKIGPTANKLTEGVYTVIVTDDNGCTKTKNITITEPSAISISITDQTDVKCNGDNTGSATVNASGGAGGYTYSWSTGKIGPTANKLTEGVYTVTVTDDNACTKTKKITITEPSAISIDIVKQSDVKCKDDNTGGVTVIAAGGAGGYTYNWSNGKIGAINNNLFAGIYTVTVTDDNACTKTKKITITEPSAISISITDQTDVRCNGDNTGSITVNASGGAGGYVYNWSTGKIGPTANKLTEGIYTVTVTDANACTKTKKITITEPSVLSIDIVKQSNIKCNGNNTGGVTVIAAGGVGGYTYNWSNGKIGAINNNLFAGVYTLTVTDDNACTAMLNVDITQPNAALTATINPTDAACGQNNGTATISNINGGTPTYSYRWPSGGTGATENNLAAGVYTATITDANNCTLEKDASIIDNGSTITTSGTISICSGQSAIIHGISQNTAGVYSQTFVAIGGCDSISDVTLIVNNPTNSSIITAACNSYILNGQTYNATGIYTQTLINAAGCDSIITLDLTINGTINTSDVLTICAGQSAIIHGVSQNTAGVYSQTFVAIGGCDSISDITLVVNNNINTSSTLTICSGQSVMIHGISQNTAGIYSQTFVAIGGCDSISDITLVVNNSINTSGTIAICSGQSAIIHGVSQTTAGIYSQTFVAVNGCDSISNVTLIVNNSITTSGTISICSGQSAMIHGVNQTTAGIYSQTFVANGGCDSISDVTLTVNNLTNSSITTSACNSYILNGQTYNTTGIYTQTLINATGCDSVITLDLTINGTINTSGTISICSGQSAIIHGISQTTAGVYSQTFVAIGGCDSISDVTLVVNNSINTSATIPICSGQSAIIHGISQNTAGIYSQTFVANGGCDSISDITLIVNNNITTSGTIAICSGQSAIIHGVSQTTAGIYSQTFVAVNGCDSISDVTLIVNNSITTSGTVSICSGQSAIIHGISQNTAGVYSQTFVAIGGCDSISDITLVVNNSINTPATITICAGQSAMIHGISQNTAGVYSQTFVAIGGCDSISDVTLIVNNPTNSSIITAACNSYILNGQTYNATGIYTQTLINAAGCDSIITLDLTINGTINTSDVLTICAGQSAIIHGISQNTAGVYSQTFVAIGGCDSISDITLVVNNSITTSGTISICSGQSAMIHGVNQNIAGVYSQTFVAIGGCDSISDITLLVNNSINTSGTINICSGQSAVIHGVNQTTAGIYSQTFVAIGGCDSISDITLVVNNSINTSGTISICSGQSAIIHGVSQNTAGVYSQTFVAIGGCDSISDVTLIVNNPTNSSIITAACNSYILNGQTYNATGIYTQTLINAAGCDSIITLDLTINGTINTSDVLTICAGQSAIIHGISQNTAGVYSQTFVAIGGCDSISDITLVVNSNITTSGTISICSGQSAMIHGVNQTTAGIYSQTFVAIGGCDSISDITLIVNELPAVNFTSDVISGCSPVCVTFNNTTANTSTLQWDFGDGNISSTSSPKHCFTKAGSYNIMLTVTDNNACSNTANTTSMITVHPNPVAEFTTDLTETTLLQPHIQFTDLSQGSGTWQWDFGDNNQGSADQHPQYTYSDTGTYNVKLLLSNEFGCVDSIMHEIRINPDYVFFVPNAITPNRDGLNDIFIPQNTGLRIEDYELAIYNRWGNLVFKTNNIHEGWNARMKNSGDLVPQDTYVWTITTRDIFRVGHIYKGVVNVIR